MPNALSQDHSSGTESVRPGAANILLVEQSAELLESRRLVLGLLKHPVVALAPYEALHKQYCDGSYCLVALDPRTAGENTAPIAAHVRKSWPTAKILLLGPVPPHLADYLYDDTVDACCNPAGVISSAQRLLDGSYRLIRDHHYKRSD